MILGVSSLKGGAGKSTLSQNLAVFFNNQGYKVCIVDTDSNQSSAKWSGFREQDDIQVTAMMDAKQLLRNSKMLEKQYDLVIIDGTPAISAVTNSIIMVSDLIVVPMIASALDVWATEMFLERLDAARAMKSYDTPAYFVLNMYNGRLNLSKEVADALKDYPVETLESTLAMRVAYREAVISGRGVVEYSDPKAAEEINQLGVELLGIMAKLLENVE